MKVIWKWQVPIEDEFSVQMQQGTEVLSVQTQGWVPQMWALVPDTDAPVETRRFAVRGTGHPLYGHEGRFIGTFQMDKFGLVFHLFEAK